MPPDAEQRALTARLLAVQQQNIDLRARLDREHQAGEGFLRFGERALGLADLQPFWEVATEETVSTFGVESALLLRLDATDAHLCATCCASDVLPAEVRALGVLARRSLAQRVIVHAGPDLPPIAGRATAVLFVAGYLERGATDGLYALVGTLSVEKQPFYPTMDANLGPLFAAFANHAAALQQHIRAQERARAVAGQLLRLAEVANRTSNAVIIADRAGRIEWVNESFEQLTGWRLADVQGQLPSAFLQGPRTDPLTQGQMDRAIRAGEPFDVEVVHYTRQGRQYWVQIESQVIRDEAGEPTGFVAIETDVTERRLTARQDGLAQRVAALLLESIAFEDAARRLTQTVVDELGELGVLASHLWIVEPRRDALVALAGCAADATGAAGARFADVTRELTFVRGTDATAGVGVPGAAWGTERVWFESDLASSRQASRRFAAATAAGIDGLCAAPILGPAGVLGVIEVACAQGAAGVERLPSILARVAEQVASFLLHDQSRRAFRSIFDQSPDGMLLVDETGRLLATNARARRLFGPVGDRRVGALLDDGLALVGRALDDDDPSGVVALTEPHHVEAHALDGRTFLAEVSAAVAPFAAGRAVILAVRDRTERHRMEVAIQQSLHEKETLLQEIHHRVKNNLQIISSLLMLQVDHMPSELARRLLEESVGRVRSMALIHQQLYGAESLERIDMGDYARELAGALRGALAPDARLDVVAEVVEVHVEKAVPLGLILNEVITNAFKYGHPPNQPSWVRVAISCADRTMTLTVHDSGPGLPAHVDPRKGATLGMELVDSLSRQIRGKYAFSYDDGGRFQLVCAV